MRGSGGRRSIFRPRRPARRNRWRLGDFGPCRCLNSEGQALPGIAPCAFRRLGEVASLALSRFWAACLTYFLGITCLFACPL
jgi:hypothetical protein